MAIPVKEVEEEEDAASAVLIANWRKLVLDREVASMSKDLQIRSMTSGDVQAAMRLKEAAHWNQVAEDWNGFLEIEASGCFAGELDGEVVTTATNFDYENRFGWIGMILVDPVHRRKGIATRMMNRSISYLESLPCPCQKLDATDAGAKVYEKIGFVTEYQVERWTHDGRVEHAGSDFEVSDLTLRDMSLVAEWDKSIFGASRRRLLEWYVKNPAPSLLLGDPENPRGFRD
jgi:GNAT superfamily N-acetyltransferase